MKGKGAVGHDMALRARQENENASRVNVSNVVGGQSQGQRARARRLRQARQRL